MEEINEIAETGTGGSAAVAANEIQQGKARQIKPQLSTGKTRTRYIFRGEDGKDYLIETSEGYRNRKNLHLGRSSSIKKLGRINRVHARGFKQSLATREEVRVFGPPINVSQD